jgi:hypothetical protein
LHEKRVIFEAAVAEIMIEDVTVDSGDEEIGAPVVIVVGGSGPHRVSRAGDFGHIAEAQIAFVVEEAVPIARAGLFEGWHLRAIREIDVWAAVAIVIEDGDSARHGFDQVLLIRGAVIESKGEAGLCGDFLERDRGSGAGRSEDNRPEAGSGDGGTAQQGRDYLGTYPHRRGLIFGSDAELPLSCRCRFSMSASECVPRALGAASTFKSPRVY